MLARFTQIDYDRELALIAVVPVDGRETEIGVARYVTNPDGKSCEFAMTRVSSMSVAFCNGRVSPNASPRP